jgi:hypothetical protein
VLFWLAGHQQEVVARLVQCLRPGGWLVDEDGDWGETGPVDPDHPLTAPHDANYRNGEWWSERGFNPKFGGTLPILFERAGLVDIRHEARTEVMRGGSPWARWWADGISVANALLTPSHGTPDGDFDAVRAPFLDPTARVSASCSTPAGGGALTPDDPGQTAARAGRPLDL